ncbi:hypothetical protein [Vibrio parahaemolyticus]|uniref:hypothetical protein n=1 Tax=Vibrio parahaemolyticus TaxID=670 RepID=UPI002B1F3665|nr:hypothetical protein [Vibrio parahaemolyticus]MEA5243096.1 hypothetical protein [Vibrio parahaemolyticus]
MVFDKINVNNLLLDLDNSRFPSQPENQRQAIEFMLKQQGDKLFRLAKDIIEFGLDPSERLVVVKDESENYVVVEGNRRVTTLKLLQNIDMVEEDKTTRKIKNLLSSNPEVPQAVECVVYQQDDEGYEHWVNLKHTGENDGVGRVHWKGQEVDRHRAKHGETSFGNQLITFISKEQEIKASIKSNTNKLKITNITRLLGDPAVRARLALHTVTGSLFCKCTKEQFIERITKLLDEMLECDDNGKIQFTVNRIKKKDDREDFMNQLGIVAPEQVLPSSWKLTEPKNYSPKIASQRDGKSEETDKPNNGSGPSLPQDDKGQPQGGSENQPPKDHNPDDGKSNEKPNKPNSSNTKGSKLASNPNRNMLIPSSCKLTISDKKCSGLFRELKNKLTFEDHRFSISVLIRVFLEMSVSHYMNRNQINLQNPKKTGLHDKVVAVVDDLLSNKKVTGQEATSLKASSNNYFKASGAGQQYVHNIFMMPDKVSINTMWDNLEPLFKGIWQD